MARYKPYNLKQDKWVPLSYADQVLPGRRCDGGSRARRYFAVATRNAVPAHACAPTGGGACVGSSASRETPNELDRPGPARAHKNFIVDDVAVRALKQALRVPTESEAVRIAVRDRLAIEEAQAAFGRIRRRGSLDDLFQRSAPDRRGGKNGRAPGRV